MKNKRKNAISKTAKIILTIVMTVISLSFSLFSANAFAESLNEKQKRLKDEIKENENRVSGIKKESSELSNDVQNIINQINEKEKEIKDLEVQAGDLTREISEKEKEIEELTKNQEEKEELIKKRMRAIYMNGTTSYLEILLSSEDLISLVSNYNMISQINKIDQKLISGAEQELQKIDATSSEIEVKKKLVEEKKESIKKAKEENEKLKAEKEKRVSELGEEEKQVVGKIDELKREEQEISNEIAAYERRKRQAIQSANSSGGVVTGYVVNYVGGKFGWPVPGNIPISTRYGVSGRYWSSGYHTGTDFAASSGTPVYASNDGIVVSSKYKGSYGRHIIIDHGGGMYSLYAHLSASYVSAGDSVKRGEKIGAVGETGNVTGPHLHFEIRKGGPDYSNHVNPEAYLR